LSITHWYEQHSGICPEFVKAISCFQDNHFHAALKWFAQADLLTKPDDHFCYLYLVYHGLTRIILGELEGIEQCRYAGHFEQYEADVHFVLAQAEMRLANRLGALNAIRIGLSIEPAHKRLIRLRFQLGRRRKLYFKSLSRNHFLNRLFSRMSIRID